MEASEVDNTEGKSVDPVNMKRVLRSRIIAVDSTNVNGLGASNGIDQVPDKQLHPESSEPTSTVKESDISKNSDKLVDKTGLTVDCCLASDYDRSLVSPNKKSNQDDLKCPLSPVSQCGSEASDVSVRVLRKGKIIPLPATPSKVDKDKDIEKCSVVLLDIGSVLKNVSDNSNKKESDAPSIEVVDIEGDDVNSKNKSDKKSENKEKSDQKNENIDVTVTVGQDKTIKDVTTEIAGNVVDSEKESVVTSTEVIDSETNEVLNSKLSSNNDPSDKEKGSPGVTSEVVHDEPDKEVITNEVIEPAEDTVPLNGKTNESIENYEVNELNKSDDSSDDILCIDENEENDCNVNSSVEVSDNNKTIEEVSEKESSVVEARSAEDKDEYLITKTPDNKSANTEDEVIKTTSENANVNTVIGGNNVNKSELIKETANTNISPDDTITITEIDMTVVSDSGEDMETDIDERKLSCTFSNASTIVVNKSSQCVENLSSKDAVITLPEDNVEKNLDASSSDSDFEFFKSAKNTSVKKKIACSPKKGEQTSNVKVSLFDTINKISVKENVVRPLPSPMGNKSKETDGKHETLVISNPNFGIQEDTLKNIIKVAVKEAVTDLKQELINVKNEFRNVKNEFINMKTLISKLNIGEKRKRDETIKHEDDDDTSSTGEIISSLLKKSDLNVQNVKKKDISGPTPSKKRKTKEDLLLNLMDHLPSELQLNDVSLKGKNKDIYKNEGTSNTGFVSAQKKKFNFGKTLDNKNNNLSSYESNINENINVKKVEKHKIHTIEENECADITLKKLKGKKKKNKFQPVEDNSFGKVDVEELYPEEMKTILGTSNDKNVKKTRKRKKKLLESLLNENSHVLQNTTHKAPATIFDGLTVSGEFKKEKKNKSKLKPVNDFGNVEMRSYTDEKQLLLGMNDKNENKKNQLLKILSNKGNVNKQNVSPKTKSPSNIFKSTTSSGEFKKKKKKKNPNKIATTEDSNDHDAKPNIMKAHKSNDITDIGKTLMEDKKSKPVFGMNETSISFSPSINMAATSVKDRDSESTHQDGFKKKKKHKNKATKDAFSFGSSTFESSGIDNIHLEPKLSKFENLPSYDGEVLLKKMKLKKNSNKNKIRMTPYSKDKITNRNFRSTLQFTS